MLSLKEETFLAGFSFFLSGIALTLSVANYVREHYWGCVLFVLLTLLTATTGYLYLCMIKQTVRVNTAQEIEEFARALEKEMEEYDH